jgi:hypothetical protein
MGATPLQRLEAPMTQGIVAMRIWPAPGWFLSHFTAIWKIVKQPLMMDV